MINGALSQLSSRQKEAIFLKYNFGLDYEEVSKVLNINYQSARNLIHRGISRIRKVIHKNLTISRKNR
jgi:RNA polymerase sigma factor (sigma-70 family)